ncbi:hypothetical protein AB0F17_44890 [Nonomuraea sp. NPDC026600]|uniref:hypothetical protein n=1 Tax=Nonomuraea sp. NPDC026600 TaxID=3155363 RepID=UPI0033E1192F
MTTYVLAFAGVGPFCLVEHHPGIRVSTWETAVCGARVVVCDRAGLGVLFQWEAGDPVHEACERTVAARDPHRRGP